MAGAAKRITLPRIDTGASWKMADERRVAMVDERRFEKRVDEKPVEERLLSVIAEVLGREQDTIQLTDSFTDLGGDQRSAAALRKACVGAGMAVRTKDVLRCRTLAELQTCGIPCTPRSAHEPSPDSLMVAPLRIRSAGR